MSLPIKPMIAEAVLCRGERPYKGAIEPGDIFAWEPDLPHARELVVVTRVEWCIGPGLYEARIWARDIDSNNEHWNPEEMFRQAVVPTHMRPHSLARSFLPVPWPFGGL